MSYTKSNQISKSKLSEESSLQSAFSDFDRDDEDPLSIGNFSLSLLGIIIACLTILLPLIGVLLGRPLYQGSEIITNHSIKKDGS